MFTLSTGSFRHIEEQFLADFAARRAGEPLASLLVMSPSGRLLTHLQQRLAAQGPGYLNITFLTFYALAERLLEDSGYTEPVVTSAYVARLPEAATLERLGLRPVTDAGKVWLLLPDDEGVFLETRTIQGLPLASDAQIYLDLQKTGLRGPDQAAALRNWEGFCRK